MEDKQKIEGAQNPTEKENTGLLSKEEIMFKVDEDGKAVSEVIEVEIYDRELDDEILLTTMELDNALTLHESTDKAKKQLVKATNFELDKLRKRVKELEELPKLTDEQKKLLEKTRKDLEQREVALTTICLQNDTKLMAFRDKAKESRELLNELESMIEKNKKMRKIEAIPCNVAEAHKYFNKHMYKIKGIWTKPKDDEDNTYISHLLAEKISSPKLTVAEWDMAKPSMRLSCKETIAQISYYHRPSPKDLLIERRRSEKLKNMKGE